MVQRGFYNLRTWSFILTIGADMGEAFPSV